MTNHAHRRRLAPRVQVGPPPGLFKRVRLFIAWFFAPRVFPAAWQIRPYLRNRDRPPGKFRR